LLSAITTTWLSEAQLFTSLFDEKVCMQAFCPLYRQGKLATADKPAELRYVEVAFDEYLQESVIVAYFVYVYHVFV
jgi:hypothetical protein